MSEVVPSQGFTSDQLCLECGLCCNGVIFANVELQTGDDPTRLQALGLRIARSRSASRAARMKQPCSALEGCRCRVYENRPRYCRLFDCALLKTVLAGRTRPEEALRIIGMTRGQVTEVHRLLRALGEGDERTSLSVRFRRVSERLQRAAMNRETAETFGKLTLAMHGLSLTLSEKFYPGADGKA